MRTLHLDIETFSGADLRRTGVYPYADDPLFEILMCAYSVDQGPVRVAVGEEEITEQVLPYVLDPLVIKVAHNAQFERVCFSRFAGFPLDKFLSPHEWRDTMVLAAEWGFPRSLDKVTRWLGGELKDQAGTALIKLFCTPAKDGSRSLPEDHPEKWDAFVEYCRQDVVTLLEVDERLGEWPTEGERALWETDQRINDRGVEVDLSMAWNAMEAAEVNQASQKARLREITGVSNPASTQQLKGWLEEQGLALPDLRAETVEEALSQQDEGSELAEVLELRLLLALAASSKYKAAINVTSDDGRLRGGFTFYGAHTGRWAGRGLQLHNLPRAAFEYEVDEILARDDLARHRSLGSEELKMLVRSLLIGPFTVSDYSAIEARVLAWLADERWALEAFRNGRDIYVETAERMSEAAGAEFTRFQGKVAVLALGYGGGPNALKHMGYSSTPDPNLSAEENDRAERREMRTIVNNWRTTNSNIVQFWKDLDLLFLDGGDLGLVQVEIPRAEPRTRLLRLPSGRSLAYHRVGQEYVNRTFEDDEGEPYVKRIRQLYFRSPKTGFKQSTYGGRLAENITQAVARDVLGSALVGLEQAGHRVVGHVHDEVLVEGRDLDGVTKLMTRAPEWARSLPINADGFICDRYRKG